MTHETNPKQRQSRWALMWLAYTGFLLIQPLVEPSMYLWLGTIAVFVIFFSIFWGYFYSTAGGTRVRFWMIGATFVLGLATFPWNHGASTFFIYAAALLPFIIESVPRVVGLILVECAVILAQGAFFTLAIPPGPFHIGWPNTILTIFLVVVIGGGNIYFAEQKRAECKLRTALQENLSLAAVAERERIARDLHDVLGHTLSVIVLKAELASRLVSLDPERATTEMVDVEGTARAALGEIREAIGGYRSRGFAAEIEAARRTLDAAGVMLITESVPPGASFSPQEETALSLALREAVTNIVRHARASTCRLCFITEAGRRRLLVEDDGRHPFTHEGNGLRGMRERIETLGGRFSIESGIVQDHGIRLVIDLPKHEATAS
ncbi:MAG TPA: sensor histidine kinase [Terracidiphilus sp.]|jgi:two-component system sensor histidine kinase DesK